MQKGRCPAASTASWQQEVEGYEVLLVDDGSTDGSFALMEAYQKRRPDVIRIFQKPNGGQGDARNFGMDQARGEFLTFVDSDDFVVEGCYPALLNTAEETGCDILLFDACRDYLSYQRPWRLCRCGGILLPLL